MGFAANLSGLRIMRGMTQETLAECINVSRSTVAKWESGEGRPKISNLISMRSLFRVSIDELLMGEDGMEILPAESDPVPCCRRCGRGFPPPRDCPAAESSSLRDTENTKDQNGRI